MNMKARNVAELKVALRTIWYSL